MSRESTQTSTRAPGRVRVALRWLVIGGGLLLWVGVPVVCISVVRDRADRVALAGRATTTVEAEANTQELVSGAGLRLRWAAHSPVVAPAWTGTLTDLRLGVGDRARDGSILGSVDGVDRMLVASERPFSRSLVRGDRGIDVRALNDLLRRRGLPASADDTFGPDTTRGVTALARALGAGPAEAFDPAWVLYLSHDRARITVVRGTVGAPAPPAGEVVVGLAPDLVGADVIDHQDAPPDAPSGAADGDDGGDGDGDGDGGDTGTAPSTSTEAAAPVADAERQEVPRSAVLRVDATELRLAEDRASLALDALPRLRALVEPLAAYADATIAQPPAEGNMVVPAGAVVSDQRGVTCVLVMRSGRPHPEPAIVIGGDSGRSIVVPGNASRLRPGVRVQVGAPAGHRSCR
ncbi:MAG: hypothetical protein JWO77_1404 [Ilumatobacteraceae bacterium]|nr:hypothetical protein [Ilumatobacteraceae bacterium]